MGSTPAIPRHLFTNFVSAYVTTVDCIIFSCVKPQQSAIKYCVMLNNVCCLSDITLTQP